MLDLWALSYLHSDIIDSNDILTGADLNSWRAILLFTSELGNKIIWISIS
jgi:hypothetical protein